MSTLLIWLGRLGGTVGALLCAIAILARVFGVYNLAGFQVGTFLLAGVAATSLGCLGYIAALAERRGSRD